MDRKYQLLNELAREDDRRRAGHQRKRRTFKAYLHTTIELTENSAIGGASPGSGVATPAQYDVEDQFAELKK